MSKSLYRVLEGDSFHFSSDLVSLFTAETSQVNSRSNPDAEVTIGRSWDCRFSGSMVGVLVSRIETPCRCLQFQERKERAVALLASEVKRTLAGLCFCMLVSSVLEQERHDLSIAMVGSQM